MPLQGELMLADDRYRSEFDLDQLELETSVQKHWIVSASFTMTSAHVLPERRSILGGLPVCDIEIPPGSHFYLPFMKTTSEMFLP